MAIRDRSVPVSRASPPRIRSRARLECKLIGGMLMYRLTLLVAGFALTVVFALPSTAPACPNCRDAIPASSGGPDDDGFDPVQEAKAWNDSIYLFVSMPYLLLGVFGLCVYRAM